MSTSKKKRLGSQRRSLNQNVQLSPETSDTATSPPVPQARQRADAKADLTLRPDSEQTETSARKKKLGSQRGNKGNLQFKDVTTESSNKPIEEVEDGAPHLQAANPVGINNEKTDESLEINSKSIIPESEAASSVLTDASNLSLSAITTMSQKSVFQDTKMDIASDLPVQVAQSEKYSTEIARTEEGVITEKDQTQQMPGIFEATIPVGVTGESTVSDRLIEHEEINITGSHDHNKLNTEEKAGLIEKPVCQESSSSPPTAKPRKMGSSRRKRVINLEELQDQSTAMPVQSNVSNTLEATGLTIVDNTPEGNVCVSATGVTNTEEGQVEINLSPKIYEENPDDLSDVAGANLSEAKETEKPDMENVLVEMKAQGDQIKESKFRDEQLVCLQNEELSELSFTDIPPTNDTKAHLTSLLQFDAATTVGDVEEAKILEAGENVTLQVGYKSDKQDNDIGNKDTLKTTKDTEKLKDDSHPKEDASFDNFVTDEEYKEKEGKDDTSVSCNSATEFISELKFTEDETITERGEPIFSAQSGIHPFTEGLLHLDKNEKDLLNYTVDQEASSMVCPTSEENILVESVNGKNVNITEPLISFIDEVSIIPGQNLSDEQKGEPFDFSLQISQSVVNEPLSTQDVSLNYDTYLKENTSNDFYANEQNSDQSSVTKDMSESSSMISSTNDETVETMFGTLRELKPTIEGISHLDENKYDVLNISTTTESIGANKNETDVAHTIDVHQITSSSVSETLEDENSSPIGLTELDEPQLVFKTNTEDVKIVDLLAQQSEPLVSFTDGVSTDSIEPYKEEDQEEIKLSDEQLVDLPSEPKRLNPQMEETNAPLTSLFPDIAASVDDVTAIVCDTQDKTTPEIPAEELESPKTSVDNKDLTASPDNIDKSPLQGYDKLTDNEDMNYTSKATDKTGIVEMKDMFDPPKSSEPQVYSETIGEPFENVQRLDAEVNAPDTDPHHDPVRRKFGSSRRSKARKDVTVTTVDKDDALSAETENLPSSVDIQTDEQNEPIKKEGNIKIDNAVDAEIRELVLPNEEVEWDQGKEKLLEFEANILGLDEEVSKLVDDGISQPTEQSTSNQFVLSEADKDENQQRENDEIKAQRDDSSEIFAVQIPQTDDKNAAMAPIQPDATVSLEDGSAVGSQLIKNRRKLGSSRRIKGQRQANNEQNPEEINIMSDGKIAKPEIDPVIAVKNQESAVEKDVGVEETDNNSQSAVQDQSDEALVTVKDLIIKDELSKPTEVTVLGAEQTADDEISASADHRVLDNAVDSLYRQETSTEPKGNTETSDINTESYALKETINVHQLTYISDSEMHEEMDNSSVQQSKQPVLEETVGEPLETVKLINTDPELFLLSDKDQSVVSTQEKQIKTQVVSLEEKTITDIQKDIPEAVGDSFTIKDLKDKGNTEEESLPRAVDVDNKSSQSVVGPEDISAKIDDAMQSVVVSAEDIIKGEEVFKVSEVSEASDKLQISSQQKRRKMGSTRRSQVNRKQLDEESNAEDNATLSVKATIEEKDISPAVNDEDAQPLSSDTFVNQGEATFAAGPVKDPSQSEESTERQEVTQEDKDNILQTEVEDIDEGATTQSLLPIAGEEIQPSSPGKRRKMGSTRKNLSTKRESPQEGTVTPVNLEQKVSASSSNDNDESKEQSGLLAYTATVHQPPPDEETPLSPQVSQEKLRLESKETELSSQPEAMAEDAVVARRRKMGSHRKPHSDQGITQRSGKDGEESLLHPLGDHRTGSPRLAQISEANMGDNKASSSATAFNIKLDSRPVSDQPPLPSINVHRVQQSNIRISAGFDRSASRYEVVMIGDSSVGKTSFIQRAQSGKFSSDVPASIGMDSYKWTVVINGKTTVLHLWDTAGQERFRSMTKQIFHRAQAFLLMYDVTCAQTFTAVSYWANCIKDGAAENAVVLLLGNKCDRTERKVPREEGEILAEENSFAFMECSAATGENVVEALETVARLLTQKADTRSEEPLMLRKPEPKNKSGCC